ncbi:MAG: LysM peptidoglycan-binding domain-containing protein [Patescibacteria group bacterium]
MAIPAAQPTKRSSKGRVKSSTVAIYTSVFALLVAVIAVGYRAPEQDATAAFAASLADTNNVASGQPSVNDVIATNIAASAALAADLAVAPNIAERAVSTRVQNQYAQMDTGNSVNKPTIVQLSSASRNITPYAVQPGDTVQTVAAKFAISTDTVKWANNLTADTLAGGSTIDILPRNGIAYTVKDGDTIEKLAEKYKTDASLISTYNDLEISGLTTGLKIILPDGVLPNTERPGYVAPVASYSYTTGGFVSGYGAWSGSVLSMRYMATPSGLIGGYAPGNCTAYAFMRRAQLGMPVPSNLGNAYTWATQARAFGYAVDKNPSFGAVIQSGNHVGIVEEVLANGDLRITDMNYGYRLNNLAERIIPASTVNNYMFIH